MPIRQLSLPFRIGIDICNISRIVSIIKSSNSSSIDFPKLKRFTNRILTPLECDIFLKRLNPSTPIQNVAHSLGGKWAAKEAIIKASRNRIFMNQIFIHKSREGAPWAAILDQDSPSLGQNLSEGIDERNGFVRYNNSADSNNSRLKTDSASTEDEIKLLNGKEVALSISHDGDYAIAIAMVTD
jgi:phosphopantetheine--protein transferase-like protein